jgi:muramoyltetrapeptide carboxypeptidase
MLNMISTPFLNLPARSGIAIVPLSSAALSADGIQRGEAILRERGFTVHNYYRHEQRYQRFGANDESRLAALYDAVERTDVQVIMALRGGYGLSRLLAHIDFVRIATGNKIFVGFSDFNALQLALLAKTGLSSLCGPTLCDDFTRADVSDMTLPDFFNCLQQAEQIGRRQHAVAFQVHDNQATNLQVQGKLWGGNLAMLVHLLGSEFFPQVNNGILFVEDVGEHPYRVERMMLQLLHAGILQQQKAIVMGNFSAYKLAEHDNGYDFEQMLAYLRGVVKVPIITGLPFGHIKDKVSLVIGSEADLQVNLNEAVLTMKY